MNSVKLKNIVRTKYFIARTLLFIAKLLIFVVHQITKLSNNHIRLNEKLNLLNKTIYKFDLMSAYKNLQNNIVAEDISFAQHNIIVKKIYGETQDVAEGIISQELLQKLLKLTKETEEISASKAYEEETNMNSLSGNYDNSNLLIKNITVDKLERENVNKIIHPLRFNGKDIILNQLHLELKKIFFSYIKSPFIFVNTRLWTTKPKSEVFGSNAFHLDGFEPGHLKIMTYLTPLDDEHGYFEFQNKIIKNKPAGYSIIFKNSDIIHRGVPGTKKDRISLEVTIMRALVNRAQMSTSSYWGRHLINPMIGYKNI